MRNDENSNVPPRSAIHVGQKVWAVEKRNYSSGILTEGIVKRILTNKPFHPRGTKVMFEDGTVARVQSLTPPTGERVIEMVDEGKIQEQVSSFDDDLDLR